MFCLFLTGTSSDVLTDDAVIIVESGRLEDSAQGEQRGRTTAEAPHASAPSCAQPSLATVSVPGLASCLTGRRVWVPGSAAASADVWTSHVRETPSQLG